VAAGKQLIKFGLTQFLKLIKFLYRAGFVFYCYFHVWSEKGTFNCYGMNHLFTSLTIAEFTSKQKVTAKDIPINL